MFFLIQAASQKLNRWFPSGKCGENDLEVICTITSATQITTFYYIQLLRNTTSFEPVVSIFHDQAPQIQWPNGSILQTRATVSGSINSTSAAFLKYRIDKNRVQCLKDYNAYKCRFEGFSKIKRDAVTEEANPISVFYSGKLGLGFGMRERERERERERGKDRQMEFS